MTINQKIPKKIHLALFFAHSLIVILWYIDLIFFASGLEAFFLILFAIYYTGYGIRFFFRKFELLSFFSILLPCLLIFLFLTLPIGVNVFCDSSKQEKVDEIYFFPVRIQYQLRKKEFKKDIEKEKKKNPKMTAMRWRPMSGENGPVFIYSEIKLPINQYVHHADYIPIMPDGENYAVEMPRMNEKPYYPDGGYSNDCYGYMSALDKNFYVFFNSDCY